MVNFIKKNWFVCLIVLALCGVSIFYIVDTNKGKLRGKTVNGEDVVYSINGQDITTSAFYNQLYKSGGIGAINELFRRAVTEQAIESTDEITAFAEEQASQIIASYQSQNPTNYKETLETALKSMGYSGYDDLAKYLENYRKSEILAEDYAKNHFDELKIRSISYILIQYENNTPSDKPTDDEKKRMEAVDEAFENGDDFATVATNFSEDQSSAPNGGILGIIDKNVKNLDDAFLEASLSLKEGEVSDWIKSDNFGYFKIKNNASTLESLNTFYEENPTDSSLTYGSPLVELFNSYDTSLPNVALFEKAEELGVDFKDQP
ncbi:MAG: peptidylprolyl isomerase, partial [Solobacterium sp.]|nr:peptidylprolyl isomerase [Solobacterium sp.]